MLRKDWERWHNGMAEALNATGNLLLSLLIGLCSLTIFVAKKGKKGVKRAKRKRASEAAGEPKSTNNEPNQQGERTALPLHPSSQSAK